MLDMEEIHATYVNPFTDFGFKKVFGEEASKPALIDFLNSLLQNIHIKDIHFKNNEQLSDTIEERKAIFDIYCETENGEKIIVELQKARQNFFKERTIYYSTFPIREQVEKGDWNFNLKAVYCIGILDFRFKDYSSETDKDQVVHRVSLKDQNGKPFYDKLSYIYLEMPKFQKSASELENRLDKWLYFINNLENFENIPEIFRDEVIFTTALEKAKVDNYSPTEKVRYQDSLKGYRDWHNIIETAAGDAKNEGIREQQIKTVIACIKEGMAIAMISRITGLTEQEMEAIKTNNTFEI